MQAKLKTCRGCGEEKHIWKRDKGAPYCKYCWSKVKANEPLTTSKAPRKPIPKKSQKMKEKDAIYSKLRPIYLNSHPMCEVAWPGCTGPSTEVHHKKSRGIHHNDIETWVAICRHCHHHIHFVDNPRAKKEGLL